MSGTGLYSYGIAYRRVLWMIHVRIIDVEVPTRRAFFVQEGGLALGWDYRVTSLIRNNNPPQGHHKALGIFLLQDPRGARFFMSKVPLYALLPPEGSGLRADH